MMAPKARSNCWRHLKCSGMMPRQLPLSIILCLFLIGCPGYRITSINGVHSGYFKAQAADDIITVLFEKINATYDDSYDLVIKATSEDIYTFEFADLSTFEDLLVLVEKQLGLVGKILTEDQIIVFKPAQQV